MRTYDITRTLSSRIAVWPGDQPFEARWSARIEEGSSVNVGALTLSTHTGTHVDAPLHYAAAGAPVDGYPLLQFIGPAIVVHIRETDVILPAHVQGLDLRSTPRVLFRTRSSLVADDRWEPDFVSIHPDTITFLAERQVVLIGTDAPSVDPAESKTLPAHHALARHGIANLENLMLAEVPEGRYELVALPLKLEGLDAAPVRAVLLPAR